jgi:opacity protein-like surface antigen
MTRNSALALMVVVALALPNVVRAQMTDSKRAVSFGIGGGVSAPVNNAERAFKNGFNGQGFVRIGFGMTPIALRADVTYQNFDLKSIPYTGPTPVTLASGSGTVMSGLANAQLMLMSGHFRPYLIAGLGAYNVKTELDGAPDLSQSDTKFGVNGGGGVQIDLSVFSVYAEARVDNVFTDNSLIGTDQIQVVPVTFGIVF